MGCVSSMFQFGSYILREGGVDRKGSLPADFDEWKPSYYNSDVKKPEEPPPARPEPEIIPKATPEVTELQRVQETKLEREKITNDSGSTTEKTQYTQCTESVKIQEGKGPIAEPFDFSTQRVVFPTFAVPKSATEVSPTCDETRHEIFVSPPKMSETETDDTEELEGKTEGEKADAVVKIQAGVRGYLTRKALRDRSATPEPPSPEQPIVKETSKDVQAEIRTTQTSAPTDTKKESPSVAPRTQPVVTASDEEEEEEEEEEEDDTVEATEAATRIQAAFRGYKVRKQARPEPPARRNHQQIVVDLDDEDEEEDSDEGTVSQSDEDEY